MKRVAFQGEPGAYSEEAALLCCGRDALLVPQHSFVDVVNAVLAGGATQGILPVENSIIGPVTAATAVLAAPRLSISSELTLPILHCLLGVRGATIESVTRVFSHPAALGQCARFFETHPQLEAVTWYDTAGAAKHVASLADSTLAAIASRRAAERYGLDVLSDDIQDRTDNWTRFVVVTRSPVAPSP
ncbi:MAG: prephenate dehydratase domain-containing protein [Gemmatimonadota bacterium]